jgi:hypothetical protein
VALYLVDLRYLFDLSVDRVLYLRLSTMRKRQHRDIISIGDLLSGAVYAEEMSSELAPTLGDMARHG